MYKNNYELAEGADYQEVYDIESAREENANQFAGFQIIKSRSYNFDTWLMPIKL